MDDFSSIPSDSEGFLFESELQKGQPQQRLSATSSDCESEVPLSDDKHYLNININISVSVSGLLLVALIQSVHCPCLILFIRTSFTSNMVSSKLAPHIRVDLFQKALSFISFLETHLVHNVYFIVLNAS